MNNLHEPISEETKRYLEDECGLRAYKPRGVPKTADPDSTEYKIWSAAMFGTSLFCRQYLHRYCGVTRWPFTISCLMVPFFYLISIHHKEKRFEYGARPRKTFE